VINLEGIKAFDVALMFKQILDFYRLHDLVLIKDTFKCLYLDLLVFV